MISNNIKIINIEDGIINDVQIIFKGFEFFINIDGKLKNPLFYLKPNVMNKIVEILFDNRKVGWTENTKIIVCE